MNDLSAAQRGQTGGKCWGAGRDLPPGLRQGPVSSPLMLAEDPRVPFVRLLSGLVSLAFSLPCGLCASLTTPFPAKLLISLAASLCRWQVLKSRWMEAS